MFRYPGALSDVSPTSDRGEGAGILREGQRSLCILYVFSFLNVATSGRDVRFVHLHEQNYALKMEFVAAHY